MNAVLANAALTASSAARRAPPGTGPALDPVTWPRRSAAQNGHAAEQSNFTWRSQAGQGTSVVIEKPP
jgi:hypothetical protein